MCIILQVNVFLGTLELHETAKHKGQFSLFNYLVLGHTKHNSVSGKNCQSATPEPFSTTRSISFREHQATASRVPGMDTGCGFC